ncbi:N-6 DNA methylase, partial [Pseudomonas syringae group genomosp. 3]|uniref:N-6 DNA methylase n=2 Tax=Pseudomonas syringae group genomosp. 3 TaxID=251701 RepID=UPI0012D8494F
LQPQAALFKPYAGVSTAILIFTKGGTTERVWFYDLQADGYSLDDKRTELKGDGSNDLPDAIAQWHKYRQMVEGNVSASTINTLFGDKRNKAFVVLVDDVVANRYDLSINRYRKVEYQQEQYEDPKVILKRLKGLEREIMADLDELEGML